MGVDTSSFMAQHGEQLRLGGYAILPIASGSKAPGEWDGWRWRGLRGWTSVRASALDVEAWSEWPGCGVGVLCGPIDGGPGVLAVDLDVDDPELLSDLETLAAKHLGTTEPVDPPRRVGAPGRALLVYQVESDVRGARVGGRHGVEILGSGRQFVAYHVHPVTLRPYEWTRDPIHEVPLAELPVVTQAELDSFLVEVAKYLRVEPPASPATPRVTSSHPQPTPEAVRSAAAALRNDDLAYDDWIHRGLVLRAAFSEARLSDDEGRRTWEAFSARAPKNDPNETARKWDTFRPGQVTAASLFVLAQADGWSYQGPLNVEKAAATEHGTEVVEALLSSRSHHPPPSEPVTGDALLDVLHGHVHDIAPEPPAELLEVDGLVGDLARWITTTAPKPQPWLSLGAALATVGVLTGRRYAGPTGLRGNLLVLASAPSGAGKEHPRAAAKELLHAAELSNYVGGSKIASDSGLLSALQRHSARLFALDEFGETLGQLLSPRANSHQRAITQTITELFTSAAGTHEGTDYANAKERPREPIHQPCACFLAMSAGEPLWEALRTGQAVSGFLARWLLFATQERAQGEATATGCLDPPPELVEAAKRVTDGFAGADYGGNLANTDPMAGNVRPLVPRVPWSAEAQEEDRQLRARITWLQEEARHAHAAAILGRTRELALKVAMVRAVGRAPAAPEIERGDLAWARAVVEHCQLTLLVALERFVGDSEAEQNVKRVLDVLRRAGRDGCSKSQLTRALHRIPRRQRDDAIQDLKDAGRIVIERESTGGRWRELFRAIEHVNSNEDLSTASVEVSPPEGTAEGTSFNNFNADSTGAVEVSTGVSGR